MRLAPPRPVNESPLRRRGVFQDPDDGAIQHILFRGIGVVTSVNGGKLLDDAIRKTKESGIASLDHRTQNFTAPARSQLDNTYTELKKNNIASTIVIGLLMLEGRNLPGLRTTFNDAYVEVDSQRTFLEYCTGYCF
ncbi:hypothetical protein DBV05_g10328 [Lasiodiplodia theobromae]|uniref:Uncharacterized protein n=1 Tax=Lasiodiplodia theobromae TaxID=45133 RepID=A0A5N5D038_9PEZI|nr:hypothetical protein DBV05_g10328 [Lasiodiplodia theobromae]